MARTPRGTAEEPRRRRTRPIQLSEEERIERKKSLPDLDWMSRRPRKAAKHSVSSAPCKTGNPFYLGLLLEKPPQGVSEYNELRSEEGWRGRKSSRKKCVNGLQLRTLAVINRGASEGGATFKVSSDQRKTPSGGFKCNRHTPGGRGRSQMGHDQSPLIRKFNMLEPASSLRPDQYCQSRFIKS